MQKPFDLDTTKFAYVSGYIERGYGHLEVHFRNLLDRSKFYTPNLPEFKISSQVSRLEMGRDNEMPRVYALKFGITNGYMDPISLGMLDEVAKVGRKIARQMSKLDEQIGQLEYEPTFSDFAMRRILATGVESVIFYDSLEYHGMRPSLTSMTPVSIKDQVGIHTQLRLLETKLLEKMGATELAN